LFAVGRRSAGRDITRNLGCSEGRRARGERVRKFREWRGFDVRGGKLGAQLIATAFLAMLPSYLVERMTEYYFLSSNPVFFLWSGDRALLFIISIIVGAIVAGAMVESLGKAIAAYSSGILVLLALLYVVCEPKVCYSTGMDGLEPLRVAYFFACLGIVGAAAGNAAA
jgi:hypothetical protein